MGEDFDRLPSAGMVAMDGSTGEVVPRPEGAVLADLERRRAAYLADQAALEEYRDRQAVTSAGHKVLVAANIGGLEDIDAVIANGGDGVGLLRSEFIYLNSPDFPTEEEQFQIYKQVLERLAPRPWWCAPWIWAATSRPPILGSRTRTIPPWATGPSASA